MSDPSLGGVFVSLADRFTDRILNNLAEDLADIVMDAFKGSTGGSGGSWLSAIFSTLAGKRATGGPVAAGQSYLVGERRPEVFVPHTAGTIIPSVNAAMNRASSTPAHQASAQPILFDLRGAVMTEDIMAHINRVGSEAMRGAVAASSKIIPAERARKDRYSHR